MRRIGVVSYFSRLNISFQAVVGVIATAVVVYLLIGPLSMLLFSSFRATQELLPFEATRFTISNYTFVFTSDLTYRLLINTLQYAAISLFIGTSLAIIFARFIERTKISGRALLVVMILAPLGMPPIVEAMAWTLIANPVNGILNVWLRECLSLSTTEGPINIYSIVGMGFVTGLKLVPSIYIMIASVMARLDPALEEASLSSGASQFTTFRRITGPLMRPALLSVVILFGVLIIEMFETPALLGLPRGIFVFSTLIFDAIHPAVGLPDFGLASGYAILSLIIGSSLIYLYHIQVKRQERFVVVTGKGYRPKPVELRKCWQIIFLGMIISYMLLSTLIPFLVLIWGSLGILYTPLSFELATISNYERLLSYPGISVAVGNTLIISLGSATGTMVLALMIAWLAVRSKFRGAWIPDRLTITAVAVPSIVIALSLIFFYTRFPIPIYGTIWIIMIAHITRFIAYSNRVMSSAYLQIHQELEEASEVCGAGWLSTMRRIVLPILWPAFIRGWLWVFIHALRDVTLSLMLFVVYNMTLGALMWQIWMDFGEFELGAAIAVPLMLVSIGLSLLIARPTMAQKEASV